MAYIDKNKSKNSLSFIENDNKVSLFIAESYLDNLIRYTVSENDYLNKKNLVNLLTLVNNINEETTYGKGFSALYYKFRFLKELLDLVVNDKLIFSGNNSGAILEDHFISEVSDTYIDHEIKIECLNNIFNNPDMTNTEVLTLTKFVEEKLSYIFIYQKQQTFEDILNKIKIGSDTKELAMECQGLITDLNKKLNNVISMNEYASRDFSLSYNDLMSDKILNEYLITKRKGNHKLLSGYRYLNNMINGGFEGGRVYMFFGPTKGFKSGTLLNLAITITRFNPEYFLKDPEKTPCVVYFTQENTDRETIERLCECIFGSTEIKEWSSKQLLEGLRAYTIDKYGIDLQIIYRKNRSVSTNYLYTICDNLELEGKECICMIHDYVKRIKSTSGNPDLRIELGEVVNEFSSFAKEKGIPVITAGQLNREATRVIDQHLQGKSQDAAKMLNASHIGESLLMLENTDYGIIVNRERLKDTEEEFVSFKLIASRAKMQNKEYEYFAQPINSDGGFRIVEDQQLPEEEHKAVKNIGSYLEGIGTYNQDDITSSNCAKNQFIKKAQQENEETTAKNSYKRRKISNTGSSMLSNKKKEVINIDDDDIDSELTLGSEINDLDIDDDIETEEVSGHKERK